MMNAYESRKLERFSLKLPATLSADCFSHKSEAVKLQTVDISSGGAFFHTESPMPMGTAVEIEVIVPLDELKKLKGKRARIMVTGAVVRSETQGMAICFDEKYQIQSVPA